MHLLGISSYPARWQRLLRAVSLLVILIVLEGIATLVWLSAHPSEPGSRFFLAYSLERWGLILFTSLLVFLVALVLRVIRSRQDWTQRGLKTFEEEKYAAPILVITTIIVAAILGGHIESLSNAKVQVYYQQLLPLLLFISLIVFQVWIFLLVSLRQAYTQILKAWFPVYQDDQSYLATTNKNVLIVLIFVSLFYMFAQVNAGIKLPEAVALGDTTSYLEGAGMELRDPAFFSERRPWGILLIYKLLGRSLAAIGVAQLAFSTVAWLTLAWILAGSLRTGVGKILGFVFTLGISLSPTVQTWNHAGLSESLSISTMMLILALMIGLLQRWRLPYFLLLIFFFALWVSIHEVNLYLGLLTAIILFVFGLLRKNFRTFFILSFSIAVMLVINSHLSSLYALPRWALPLAEVITKRILPAPEYLDYFSNNGMPVTPELIALSGRWAHSDNYAILNNPGLREFSKWLFTDGKTVYAKFLVAHPIYTISMPLVNIDEMLAVDFSHLIPGYESALPPTVNEILFPNHWFWIYFALSVLAFGIILWICRSERSRIFWLIILFFTFSLPYLYLVWHGDALDLVRHAAIANIQFHLGVWLLLIFFLDRILVKRQR